jgi:hypothetical protein
MRDPKGQASLEWVAVVALVATLFALGAALAQAQDLGRHVTRQWARALCVVRGGDCARDQEPCVIASRSRSHEGGLDIKIVRLGGSVIGTIEQLSDGTFAVTGAVAGSGGVDAVLGGKGKFKLAGEDVDVDAEIDASMIATLSGARTWIVPSRAAADALLDDLAHHPFGQRPADRSELDVDLLSSAGAGLGASVLGLDADVAGGEFSQARHVSTVVDHRSRHRTLSIRSKRTWSVEVGGGVLGLSGGDAGETYAVELDAAGRPLDLKITTTGAFGGSQDLPGVLSPVAGLLGARGARDRRFEVTAHLDLTVTDNLATAQSLLREVVRRTPHFGPTATASQALRRRIDERGTVEARVLGRTVDDVNDHRAELGIGKQRIGAHYHAQTERLQLLAAASRGLDGQWITREDCVARA